MSDLRLLLVWLATLLALAIGIWGFQKDETSAARPFAPQNRVFRQEHRVMIFGHEFALPLRRMILGWAGVVLATAALWPFATQALSRKVFGRYARAPGAAGHDRRGKS
jgi:hypothetical protein